MLVSRGTRAFAAVWAVALSVLIGSGTAAAAFDDIPMSTVTGPVAVTADSYPFLATDIDLAEYGYVEEEFFLEGEGYRYDTSGPVDSNATRITTGGENGDGLYPFKTRIVVRRPASPADANGVVVAEWNNVTSTQDVEFNWFGDPYYLLRHGYTFVGVTAQSTGINSLKAFDSGRYGSLSIDPGASDALSFDVFSSVVKALKGGHDGPDPLGGVSATKVIASGESQSCGRLSALYNRFQSQYPAVDAYLLTVCNSQLRTDLPEKVVRIISESENRIPRTVEDYPDTGSIRHWEVAGGSHLPRVAFDNLNPVFTRDFAEVTATCEKFPLSLVKWPFTQNAAIESLVGWSDGGAAPPVAPRGVYQSAPTDVMNQLERDQYGIALGGIRYPDVTVPVAVNDGINAAVPGGPVFSLFCNLFGSSTPFSPELLHSLYTDQADYLAKYSEAADELATTGFLLQEDAERLKQDAREYSRLRPSRPIAVGPERTRGNFQLVWTGTEAAATTWRVQRASVKGKRNWRPVKVRSVLDGTATLRKAPQGTAFFRVRSRTVLPGTNISEPETVVTPFSVPSVPVKVDRTGPKKPKVVLKGRRAKGVFRGPVRVRIIGRPDRKLPDGTPGVGLNRRSVPKNRVIRKRGRTVLKLRTRDRLGNRSPVTRVVVRIRR